MHIADFKVGSRVYVIAEIGFNHGGDIDLALDMIDAAATAGADAVKFQSYRADHLVLDCVEHYEVIRGGELDREAHVVLSQRARERGVHFLSTPYDLESVDILDQLGSPAFKIASMDLTNLPLLSYVGARGKPVILSTGMAVAEEVNRALETLAAAGCQQFALLHCVSRYPTEVADVNLATMPWMAEEFGVPVGWSDHVLGNEVVLGAVALGACIIEKHFTTDKCLPGPDHALSADPDELETMIRGIRAIESAMGRAALHEGRPDRPESRLYRRGLYARKAIAKGTVITADMVACVRPESHMEPRELELLVGAVAGVDIRKNQAMELNLLGEGSLV